MNYVNIKKIIEGLIFSSDRSLSVKQIKDIINEEKEGTGLSVDIKTIERALAELLEKYKTEEYSYSLIQVAGAYRFATKKELAPWLAKLNKEKLKRKLSQAALETLAIISYNQPVTRSEVEAIRGVNVDYILNSLLEKDLITIKGRAETLGRPMLYATTPAFFEYLGLNSIGDLPPLKAIEEIIKSGPPEGVTQSDIDFFEEINLKKTKPEVEGGENTGDDSIEVVDDSFPNEQENKSASDEKEADSV